MIKLLQFRLHFGQTAVLNRRHHPLGILAGWQPAGEDAGYSQAPGGDGIVAVLVAVAQNPTADVQGMCTYEDLVDVTPGLTLGGLTVNTGVTKLVTGARGTTLLTVNEHSHLPLDAVTYR